MRKIRRLIRRSSKKSAVNSFTVFAAAVFAAAAAAVAAVTPATASAGVARQAQAVTAPPVPALSWHSCQGTFQCATARVPLDYRQPLGATITIAVIRHRAADPR